MAKSLVRSTWAIVAVLTGPLLGARPRPPVQASTALANVRAFAKLYGYVRFFHPSDAASDLDWDKFAVFGVGRVRDAPSRDVLRTRLEELFRRIAPTLQIYPEGVTPAAPWRPPDTNGLKPVAWQHLGVRLDWSKASPYRSLRLNRGVAVPAEGQGFGTIVQSIDAAALVGKRVRLRAQVRLAPGGHGGSGHLWLRVDRANNQRGFFENMDDRPITSEQWRVFDITGVVDRDARQVVFGVFLAGVGTLLVDDFELTVENSDGSRSPVSIANPGFEAAENLVGWFARSPGYDFAVTTDGVAEGTRALRISAHTDTLSSALFDARPAPGEAIDRTLGGGLRARIPLTLWSDSLGTLPHSVPDTLARLSRALEAVRFVVDDPQDERTRLAAMLIAWNVFEHFYPYFDVVKVDWEAQLDSGLAGARAARDGATLLHTLNRLVARLQDGHGRVYHPRYSPDGFLPIRMEWIEGQAVVTASGDSLVQRGDAVVAIDGTPVTTLVAAAEDEISGSPQWKRWRATTEVVGAGRRGTPVRLSLERQGRQLDVTITRGPGRRFPSSDQPPIAALAPGIMYVDLSRATWDEIRSRLDALAAARGVVFDLRGYPAGNHIILSHLLSGPDTSHWMQIPRIIYPDHERPTGFELQGWALQPAVPHIAGRVAFLTDGRAISYAESVMGFVEGERLGVIVGEATAGTNGNVNPFSVPGGYTIQWTGMRVVKHDGTQHHLIGVRATVRVERTRRGVMAGRDEVLEAGVRVAEGRGGV